MKSFRDFDTIHSNEMIFEFCYSINKLTADLDLNYLNADFRGLMIITKCLNQPL